MQNIVFIGAGSMAEAIIQGWVTKNVVVPQHVYVSNRSNGARLEELHNKYGVQPLRDLAVLKQADLVVLAMKPKDVKTAMTDIVQYISDHTAVLSVLAGTSIDTLQQGLGERAIARSMPNTSATIGMSATGIAFNEYVSDEQKQLFLKLMAAIGAVYEVAEDQLHAVTALSGSGPAYVYYLMEAFEEAGTQLGLPQQVVRSLMAQTLAGSAAMLKQTNEQPAELRRKVTSPGGTTEAGLRALAEHHFQQAIIACVKAAEARSRELAQGK